jgi:hypothetical protein
MLVLGLIMILLAAGVFISVLASGTNDSAALYGSVHMPTLVVFLAGAAVLLVFIMGLELVRSGVRRANANRQTKKRLRTLEKQQSEGTTAAGPTAPTTAQTTDQTTAPTTGTAPAENGPHEPPPATTR